MWEDNTHLDFSLELFNVGSDRLVLLKSLQEQFEFLVFEIRAPFHLEHTFTVI